MDPLDWLSSPTEEKKKSAKDDVVDPLDWLSSPKVEKNTRATRKKYKFFKSRYDEPALFENSESDKEFDI